MQITGRLTSDAKVKKTKDNREVVTFTLAVNDQFTSQGEKRNETEFYQCSYWINTKAAQVLTKATVVELTGRVGLNAYKTHDNELNAFLTFHVNAFKILHKQKASVPETEVANAAEPTKDDLPF